MPLNAIVRVSFQSSVPANQAANLALVGHVQNATGTAPFNRVGTACYSVVNGTDTDVGNALKDLGAAIATHSQNLDFLSISLVRI